jgi:hypothetical protein
MTPQRALSTPTAILISGSLIAVAVYFGLRSRPSPPSPTDTQPTSSPAPDAPTVPPPTARETAPDRAPSQPAPAPPSSDLVASQLTKALEAQRKTLVERCWAPAVAQEPNPPTMKLFINASFDANGQQVIRGVREERETARPEVRQCVSDALKPLQIPPPGAGVFADVPFTLP